MKNLVTQLKDLTKHIPEIKNAGIPIIIVVKRLFKENNINLPLQLIADIETFESKNDFEGIKTAIEQYINTLP
jgi:hypothetical protein